MNSKNLTRTELQRLLSKRGIASRSQAGDLIRQGRVAVNGKVVLDPRTFVSVAASVTVDGDETLPAAPPERLVVAFHKPRGVVTTSADERGRKNIYDLLPQEYHHLRAVGRLDMASSGLLLLTNDTVLADRLLNPENKLPKRYVTTVRGYVTEDIPNRFREGLEDRGEILRAHEVVIRKQSRRESTLIITLHEGKNRQIRRMCALCGHEVLTLKRISFAGIELGELKVGECRVVTEKLMPDSG